MPSPPGLGPGRLSRAVEFLESPDRVGVIFQTKVIFTLRGGGRQVMFRVSALEWGERAGVGGSSTQQALLRLSRSAGIKGGQNHHNLQSISRCSLLCTSGQLCKACDDLILQMKE